MKKKELVIALVSGVVSGVLTDLITPEIRKISWDKIVDKKNWEWLFQPQFSILDILVFVILLIALYYIATKFLIKKGDSAVKKLKAINHSIDEKKGIKITWDVGIGSIYHNDPFAYNIQIFCLQHKVYPLKMPYGRCPDSNCPNNNLYIDEESLKNSIDSMLMEQYRKIKKINCFWFF